MTWVLFIATVSPAVWAATAPEQVLFLDARADQTATTNGGTLIWSLDAGKARWWYQNVHQATVSPNGKLVAYVFGTDLLLTDVQGRNPKLLSHQASSPAWSPQGDRIAFISGVSTLQIITLDGVVRKTFPDTSSGRPSWSPDGTRIAYGGGVNVLEIGCELFEQADSGCPRYQPMGTIFTIDLETGVRTQLFTPTYESVAGTKWTDSRRTTWTPITTTQVHLINPQWSPDGNSIACELKILRRDTRSAPGSGLVDDRLNTVEANIVLLPAGGGTYTRVTTDINPLPFAQPTQILNTTAAWADDGRLFYSKTRGGAVPADQQGIFQTSAGGGTGTRINGYVTTTLQWTRLNQSGVELEIQLVKDQLKVGEKPKAVVRVTSREDDPQTLTFTDPLLRSGDADVIEATPPATPAPFILTRESFTRSFEVPLVAAGVGTTELVASMTVRDPSGNTRTLTTRKPVAVVFGGDLLIKRDTEPDSAYGLDDVYQKVPSGAQVRTNRLDGGVLESKFQVIVENDSPKPQTFRVAAFEDGPLHGWDVHYFFNGSDVSGAMRSGGGLELPELDSSDRVNLTVTITATNTIPGDPRHVRLALSSTTAPDVTLDAVEAVATLPEVNVRALEAVQVVQDWNNSVPLVAHRPTLIRVFLENISTNDTVMPVRGRMRGYRDGVEIAGSPLPSTDQTGDVFPPGVYVRDELLGSLNFELPDAWVQGSLELRFEPLDFKAHFHEPAEPGGSGADGILILKFTDMPPLPLVLHPVRERLKSGAISEPGARDMAEAVRRLRAMLPVSRIQWRIGFSPSIRTEQIPDVEDYWKINHRVKSDASVLQCGSLIGCELHQALLAYVSNPALLARGQGGGLADEIPSLVSTAGLIPSVRLNTTTAHELSHSLGRHHAVSSGFGIQLGPHGIPFDHGTCEEYADSRFAPDYPYFYDWNGRTRPFLGPMDLGADYAVYGYDSADLEVVDPFEYSELMSYCDPLWPSKLTYIALLESIQQRFSATPGAPPPPAQAQAHLLIRGVIHLDTDSVDLMPLQTLSASSPQVMPGPGPFTLQLIGPGGTIQGSFPFNVAPGESLKLASFLFLLPVGAPPEGIRITHNGQVIHSQVASAHAPTVHVLSPNGGERLASDEVTVEWEAADADGDPLVYRVEYSANDGVDWVTIATDLADTELTVRRSLLPATRTGRIRVEASDGLRYGADVSDAVFETADNAPVAAIVSPAPDSTVTSSRRIVLEALANDPEEGPIDGARVTWRSDLDGDLGTGVRVEMSGANLRPGVHTLTLTVSDSAGNASTDNVVLQVMGAPPPRLSNPRVIAGGSVEFQLRSAPGVTNVIERSANLSTWVPALTNVTRLSLETLQLPRPPSSPTFFLRAKSR